MDQTECQSTGVYNTFEDMSAQGHCETESFLLCTLLTVTLGLPSRVYIECPRPLGWTKVVDRYRQLIRPYVPKTLFCAFSEDGSIGPHIQELLVYLDPVWDECLTRWCIDLREALSGRRALPRFPFVEPVRQEA